MHNGSIDSKKTEDIRMNGRKAKLLRKATKDLAIKHNVTTVDKLRELYRAVKGDHKDGLLHLKR